MIKLRNIFLSLAAGIFIAFLSLQAPLTAMSQERQPQQAEIKIDPKIFDGYIGQYEDKQNLPGFIFSFFREGDKLYGQMTGQDKFEIFPTSETKFFLKVIEARLEFVRDAGSGRADSIILYQSGRELKAARIADQPAKDTRTSFIRREEMIPMRDGVKLYTVILTPENQPAPLPIIISRTPYESQGWNSERINNSQPELVKDGYIFIFQDIRGCYKSEGEFVMNRPLRDKSAPKSIDEATDTYDTIEWLTKNLPKNNGRVGIMGVSYPGWLAAIALVDPHPALKATSPQAPMIDTWLGDDFFHNGAFRQTYGHEYVRSMEPTKEGKDVSFNGEDAYDWYLKKKTLSAVTEYLGGRLPTWNSFVAHPNYDEYWQARAAQRYIKEATIPTMIVGGWWDQEDLFGPLALYKALEKNDKKNLVSLVMGPWNHGGWNRPGQKLGAIDFGADQSKYFRKNIQAPFFRLHLHNRKLTFNGKAFIFQSGSNKWKFYDAWPPIRSVIPRRLYLQADEKLSFEAPKLQTGDQGFDGYLSDPANPVPYRKRPIEATYDPKGSGWRPWLIQDQRFLSDRKDVLKWQGEVLNESITISGDIIANLFASTSGTDSDWVAKLIDVYPADHPDPGMAGYQLMVASEIFRGRYNKSFSKPEPIRTNAPVKYSIDLRGNDYTFLKGHRIMVQVQSSWFPLYDRNPQKYVENIFVAKESDFQAATQKIYRSPQYPSNLSVMIAK